MTHWLASNWAAVWPNLEASLIWSIPAGVGFVWHHRHLRRSLNDLHRKIDTLLPKNDDTDQGRG